MKFYINFKIKNRKQNKNYLYLGQNICMFFLNQVNVSFSQNICHFFLSKMFFFLPFWNTQCMLLSLVIGICYRTYVLLTVTYLWIYLLVNLSALLFPTIQCCFWQSLFYTQLLWDSTLEPPYELDYAVDCFLCQANLF